jgi:peptidoglycan/LPS O-acetylase OafA/YrhL
MIYLVGIRVFTQLHHNKSISSPGSTLVTLVTCLVVIIPSVEMFYRLVEMPSKLFAHKFFDFITG